MADDQNLLKPPDTFRFPFPPYDIQEQFMRELFQVLEGGKLGIFESPTGTGKSLSLICGALTWFLESEKQKRVNLEKLMNEKSVEDDDDDDWFANAGKKQLHNQKRLEAKEELERIKSKDEKLAKIRARRSQLNQTDIEQNKDEFNELFKEVKWMQKAVQREMSQGLGDEDILVEEYFSDDEAGDEFEVDEEDTSRRIFFCSRTHSQLSQFVREVKKSPFGSDVSLVSLASRAVMCVNPTVKKLSSQAAVNEKCLELGRKKSKATALDDDSNPTKKSKSGGSGCPYNKSTGTSMLRDQAVLAIHDIEDLVAAGRKTQSCPYYASRSAVPLAQMVVLPYNTLLHAGTRKAIGLNLKNSIVIIDEAHNLLDTITNIHSVTISGSQLGLAYSQLNQYKERYSSRLKAKNILYIKQLLFILSSFIKLLGGSPGKDPTEITSNVAKEETNLVEVANFLSESRIYNLELLKLIKYCNVSQICHKLSGFVEKYQPSNIVTSNKPVKTGVASFLSSIQKPEKEEVVVATNTNNENRPPSNSLQSLVELLSCLSMNHGEARMVVTKGPRLASGRIRFLLLDPANQFQQIVREAHSVVVAGGTMRPIAEFRDQLFISAGAEPSRVTHFSCDHVVPGENMLPLVLTSGPSGARLDFSFQFREKKEVLDELGRVLINIVNIVPGGIVVFFPSYDYEKLVCKHLEASGVLARIEKKKGIFREPKTSSELDKVLGDFATAVRLSKGALLLAVVGGKMSEGINFSDDLGRCVVMVGMPYPNLYSPELKEKMSFLNKTVGSIDGKQAGQVHYENLCMKAVNQSVGRAIRHKGDYAAILFLDHRYSRPNIISQLPGWISRHLTVVEKFGQTIPQIRSFFRGKE